MRAVLAVLLLISLSACEIVYKLPTRQGNVIEQRELDKVKLGMTRDQVRFVLGTPIAASPLRDDRWDYFGYYRPPRGEVVSRTVSLYFDGDQLVRMEGEKAVAGGSGAPDAKTLEAEQKKAAVEDERAKETKEGGIIKPPDQQDHPAPDQE
jgi:outer membrane protein assembly factor BamE (lipoprotein component of BamABCDE complex)